MYFHQNVDFFSVVYRLSRLKKGCEIDVDQLFIKFWKAGPEQFQMGFLRSLK